jgi:hypothetical protein
MSLPSRCDGRPQSSLARASRARGCESSMRQVHRLRARSRGNLWGRQRRAGLRAALPASGAQRIRTRQPACGPALLIQRPASCRPWGVLDLVRPAEEPVMEALWTRFSALRSSDGLRGQWLSSGALSGPGPGPGRLLAGRAGRGDGGVSARGAVSLGELRQGARSFKVCAGESKSPGESRDRGQRPGVARHGPVAGTRHCEHSAQLHVEPPVSSQRALCCTCATRRQRTYRVLWNIGVESIPNTKTRRRVEFRRTERRYESTESQP